MIHVLLLTLVTAGFVCLCAADQRRFRGIFGGHLPIRGRLLLRAAGWGLMLVAFIVASGVLGPGRGLVEVVGLASLGALAAMVLLTRAGVRQTGR